MGAKRCRQFWQGELPTGPKFLYNEESKKMPEINIQNH
jgi:hypothetical protein